MSTITLPNIRVSSDLTVSVRLKDNGVAIDWSTLNNVKASIYSDAQRALAGRCDVSVDAEDPTVLVCQYAANKPQYVGVNRIVVSAKYMGETKTYDKPAFNFVRWTADQDGEQITIDDPDVDVEIDVADVSSSLLDEAIRAAFTAAEEAVDAKGQVLETEAEVEAAEALRVSAEESRVEAEEGRVEAEAARVDEEAVRVSAEDARVVAENARAAAEDLREGAEDDRAAAETARETAEAARVAAEALRVSAEGSRETAEAARVSQASADHTVAAGDHTQAAADHTQAAADHTTAASDHTQAGADHTLAAADHVTAGEDHAQAQDDHEVMAGYDTRLGNVEGEVSQLEAKVTDLTDESVDGEIAKFKGQGKMGATGILGEALANSVKYVSDNIYDSANTESGGINRNDGTEVASTEYVRTGYINIGSSVKILYLFPNQGYAGAFGCAFYDKDKEYVGGFWKSINPVPATAKYVRISFKTAYANTSYVSTKRIYTSAPLYSPGEYESNKGKVTIEDVDFASSKNLIDKSTLVIGQYFSDGVFYPSGSYDSTQIIPITPSKSYVLGSSARFASVLYADGSISRNLANITSFTAGVGETGVVLSFAHISSLNYQMEEGTEATDYENYKKIISKDVLPVADPLRFTQMKANNASIAVGTTFNASSYIRTAKDVTISAIIGGNITSVLVGCGYMGVYGKWVEITADKITTKMGTSGSTHQEFTHGLTLGTRTKLIIHKSVTPDKLSVAKLTLIDDYGNIYTTDAVWGAVIGIPFVRNENTSGAVSASITFNVNDLLKRIWIFGDSYCAIGDSARWPTKIASLGYCNYLLDAMGGEIPSQALDEFKKLLGLGSAPSYAVWCMGMNGGADENGAVNVTWLSNTQSFITRCEKAGITPILATIPSVPTQIHTKLNEWVKDSGYRYIDFASAVEESGTNTWRGWGTANALLSSDQIHPTSHGAMELALQVLVDFPEITIKEN